MYNLNRLYIIIYSNAKNKVNVMFTTSQGTLENVEKSFKLMFANKDFKIEKIYHTNTSNNFNISGKSYKQPLSDNDKDVISNILIDKFKKGLLR